MYTYCFSNGLSAFFYEVSDNIVLISDPLFGGVPCDVSLTHVVSKRPIIHYSTWWPIIDDLLDIARFFLTYQRADTMKIGRSPGAHKRISSWQFILKY